MGTMQTISPADVWEMAKQAVMWLAGIGIVVDLTPGIKIQPVRWAIKQLGNLLNSDMKEQLDKLQKDFQDHKIDSWRREILDFANSCINHRRHTKEEFDHILDISAKYSKYIADNKLTNGQVDVAEEYIKEIYKTCMHENDFIPARPVNKEDEES